MIQLSLEAVPIKKKEKRTLIMFFLKEKSHPIQNLPSRADQKFQVLKVPRSCSYKKRKRKRTLVTFFLNEEPHRLKLTKRYISNPRGHFYKKKKEEEIEESKRKREKEGREKEKKKKKRKKKKKKKEKKIKKKKNK